MLAASLPENASVSGCSHEESQRLWPTATSGSRRRDIRRRDPTHKAPRSQPHLTADRERKRMKEKRKKNKANKACRIKPLV